MGQPGRRKENMLEKKKEKVKIEPYFGYWVVFAPVIPNEFGIKKEIVLASKDKKLVQAAVKTPEFEKFYGKRKKACLTK